MFKQLRDRYPQGCLVTELVNIHNGKYIVRALVQVEGVNLATGMAAADTVELAEDQARNRVLTLLEINPNTAGTSPATNGHSQVEQVTSNPRGVVSIAPKLTQNSVSLVGEQTAQNQISEKTSIIKDEFPLPISDTTSLKHLEIATDTTKVVPLQDNSVRNFDQFVSDNITLPNLTNTDSEQPEEVVNPVVTESKSRSKRAVTENKQEQQDLQPTYLSDFSSNPTPTSTTEPIASSTLVDLSDIIARTTVEIKRLGWSNQQGKDCLLNRYGKRGRSELTDDELLDFLNYLEAQPNPED